MRITDKNKTEITERSNAIRTQKGGMIIVYYIVYYVIYITYILCIYNIYYMCYIILCIFLAYCIVYYITQNRHKIRILKYLKNVERRMRKEKEAVF